VSCCRRAAATHAAALLSLPLRTQLLDVVRSDSSPTPSTVRCVLAALQLLRDGGLTGHATPPVTSLAASAAPRVWAAVRPLLLRADGGLGLVRALTARCSLQRRSFQSSMALYVHEPTQVLAQRRTQSVAQTGRCPAHHRAIATSSYSARE
jgi:hypothetical protein